MTVDAKAAKAKVGPKGRCSYCNLQIIDPIFKLWLFGTEVSVRVGQTVKCSRAVKLRRRKKHFNFVFSFLFNVVKQTLHIAC